MRVAAVFNDKGFPDKRPILAAPIRGLRLARLRRDGEVYLLAQSVARVRGVTLRQMLASSRGNAPAARARQLAMYLSHVLLGRPQDAVGVLFGRHASTVSYACRVMEDLRDEPAIELEIASVERALTASMETRNAV